MTTNIVNTLIPNQTISEETFLAEEGADSTGTRAPSWRGVEGADKRGDSDPQPNFISVIMWRYKARMRFFFIQQLVGLGVREHHTRVATAVLRRLVVTDECFAMVLEGYYCIPGTTKGYKDGRVDGKVYCGGMELSIGCTSVRVRIRRL